MVAEIDAADWSLRPLSLTVLRVVDRPTCAVPGMVLQPPGDLGYPWQTLRTAWHRMTPHPNIVELIDDDLPTLRYAAIDWRAKPTPGKELSTAITLARVFQHLVERVPREHWAYFLRPRLMFDLRGEPRVWFEPVGPGSPGLPPEAEKLWRRPTETMLVHALGRLFEEIGLERHSSSAALARRCRAAKPSLRIKSVRDVERTLNTLLRTEVSSRDPSWELVETGIGWLALDRNGDARTCFADALELRAMSPNLRRLAAEGLKRATRSEVEQLADLGKARRLESEGWWADAIDEYRFCRSAMTPADYHLSLARCTLGLGHPAQALDFALRAAHAAPQEVEPYETIVRIATSMRQVRVAVTACEQLAILSPAKVLDSIGQVLELALATQHLGEAKRCLALVTPLATTDARRTVDLADLAARRLVVAGSHSRETDSQAVALCLELHAMAPESAIRAMTELAARIASQSSTAALQICERLSALAPDRAVGAYAVVVEAAFQRGELAAALSLAESMLSRFPTSAVAHYRRGRCLFGLGRLLEARDALERAQQLDPKLLDAMHLRREVDRALGKVRAVVGSALPQQLAIPAHLPEVKAAMARGSVPDAVSWLENHEIGDGEARLLLGLLLVGQERYADAIRAFDRVSGKHAHAAHVGKARALAATGRGEEALRILDRVVAEDPESTEAMVVRARVVALLR